MERAITGHHGTFHLGSHVAGHIAGRAFAAEPNTQRDRRIACPPEMCPPAYTITMRAEPMATGARAPAPGSITTLPIVKTRKNVPMNSTDTFS